MRFLRLMHGGRSLFKRVRLGFTLLKSSAKAVFFDHKDYAVYCFLLVAIQYVHMKMTGFVHNRLSLSILMTELFSGENFFDVFWHDGGLNFSHDWNVLIPLIGMLYLQIVSMFFVLCALAYFVRYKSGFKESLYKSLQQWPVIFGWSLFELAAQGITAAFDGYGSLIYLIWNIITIFDVQIIMFGGVYTWGVLKKSWKLFKQAVSDIVVLDVIIEAGLLIIGILILIFSHEYLPTSIVLESDYKDALAVLILYLISVVMVFEVVVFTKLYQEIKE